VLWANSQPPQADQIATTAAQPIADQLAALIAQRTDVVTPQPHRASAELKPYALLQLLLAHPSRPQ
jgi:hypothetical protein